MRLIDADALIGELHTTYLYDSDARKVIYRKIDEQPTVNTWISVNDRLPEQQGEYLIDARSIVTIGWFSGSNGWVANDGSFYGDGSVTHWMPMPEAPKQEGEV